MAKDAVSVCMASYNGDEYIKEQIASILPQLSDGDELIIVDDCSTDNTLKVIRSFNSNKIRLYGNEENKGHVVTFERALSLANNKYIFLADQDDIWKPKRLNIMKKALQSSSDSVLTSNFDFLSDRKGIKVKKEYLIKESGSRNYLKNIIGIFLGSRHYYGSVMAFKREMLKLILPIPSFVESHDIWIAIAANLFQTNIHINEKTLIRRIHGNNVTQYDRSLIEKLKSRVFFMRSIVRLLFRRYIF